MPKAPIQRLSLRRFTAFDALDAEFSPGINILIGANATGKTHLLKVLYAASKARQDGAPGFGEKLVRVFAPEGARPGRLVRRSRGRGKARIEVRAAEGTLSAEITTQMAKGSDVRECFDEDWGSSSLAAAYIPVKEMLAHAPGFRSLYAAREIPFDETYADLIDLAFLPILRGPRDKSRKLLLKSLEDAVRGRVFVEGETFYIADAQGKLEFMLLAEGLRKLALLWILIQNGTLNEGHLLFWDEPETNLNPALQGRIVDVLLELQRAGVQVFLATHNYVLLKEFDLRRQRGDELAFHSLSREEPDAPVRVLSAGDYRDIEPNIINDAFLDLYDREVQRTLSRPNGR